jgi:hypothetical protein
MQKSKPNNPLPCHVNTVLTSSDDRGGGGGGQTDCEEKQVKLCPGLGCGPLVICSHCCLLGKHG